MQGWFAYRGGEVAGWCNAGPRRLKPRRRRRDAADDDAVFCSSSRPASGAASPAAAAEPPATGCGASAARAPQAGARRSPAPTTPGPLALYLASGFRSSARTRREATVFVAVPARPHMESHRSGREASFSSTRTPLAVSACCGSLPVARASAAAARSSTSRRSTKATGLLRPQGPHRPHDHPGRVRQAGLIWRTEPKPASLAASAQRRRLSVSGSGAQPSARAGTQAARSAGREAGQAQPVDPHQRRVARLR